MPDDDAGHVVHQWRVTGQPGGGFPPYDFTWDSSDKRWPGPAAEICARGFITRATSIWTDVALQHRTITYSPWQVAGPGVPSQAQPDLWADADAAEIELIIGHLRPVAEQLRADNSIGASCDVETHIHLLTARLAELEGGTDA
jgi:hypothetical protein